MFLGYFTERPYQDRSADWLPQRSPDSGFVVE